MSIKVPGDSDDPDWTQKSQGGSSPPCLQFSAPMQKIITRVIAAYCNRSLPQFHKTFHLGQAISGKNNWNEHLERVALLCCIVWYFTFSFVYRYRVCIGS